MTTFTSEDREAVMKMNVNELADELENARNISEVARLVKEKTIPMLRKQQEEIEYWKEMFEKAMKEQEK
jgi:predicted transport protein